MQYAVANQQITYHEERYNNSHHRTYASSSGHQYDSRVTEDPLLPSYALNNKYNYYNSRNKNNNTNRNVINKTATASIYTCKSCTFQHDFDFDVCNMCGSRKNEVIPLTPEEIEERRQKTAAAASARADKQMGGAYERKLKEKAKKMEEYEKKNKELGENHLRWTR
jgi:hypothetical protein